MPFYKIENDQIVKSDNISGVGYVLNEESYLEYTYPLDGWYYFNNLQDAINVLFEDKLTSSSIITMRQARLILLQMNLLDTINNFILTQSEDVKVRWEYSSILDRNDPLLINMLSMLNFTSQQIDDLFILAKLL